jgi:hypothetical protein
MPGFATEVNHSLGKEAACEKLRSLVDQMRDQYAQQLKDADGAWQDNVLDFRITTHGLKVNGTLTVDEHAVRLQGSLPLAAMMFKSQIVASVRAALERALAA